jgi:PII-like signaling protein
MQDYPARLLRIHISEGDRFEGKPLYEAIVAACRELKIAGATVFRGLEGYGESAAIHKARLAPRLARRDQPVLIVIVDSADNLSRLLPVVEEMMDTGLISMSDVNVVRVQKAGQALSPANSDLTSPGSPRNP